jgi:toxin ParE1/3/4
LIPDFLAPAVEADLYEAVAALAAQDGEPTADAFRGAALRNMRLVVEQPTIGSVRPELAPPPYRFWRIDAFPYLIVYDPAHTPPLVLRVLHVPRGFPPLLARLVGEP